MRRTTHCVHVLRQLANLRLATAPIPYERQPVSREATEIAALFDTPRTLDIVTKANRHHQIPIAKSTGGSVQ
jgi:hypothetical protein